MDVFPGVLWGCPKIYLWSWVVLAACVSAMEFMKKEDNSQKFSTDVRWDVWWFYKEKVFVLAAE